MYEADSCSKFLELSILIFLQIYITLFFSSIFRGRLAHGRHFTFKGGVSDCAITFVSTDVTGTSVDENYPYAALKNWLQVKQYWEEIY